MAKQGLRTNDVVISSTGTSASAFFGGTTATGADFPLGLRGGYRSVGQSLESTQQTVEMAVYNYIQAIRALGRTTINTAEISRALSIPASDVEGVISKLTHKGVRRVG